MSNPSLKGKQSSRWGSLLSGAVANLESRLDNILADEGTIASRNAQYQQNQAAATSATDKRGRAKDVVSSEQSRSSSVQSGAQPGNEPGSRLAISDTAAEKLRLQDVSEARPSSSPRPTAPAADIAATDTEPKSRASLESTATDPIQAAPTAAIESTSEIEEHVDGQRRSIEQENLRSSTPAQQSSAALGSIRSSLDNDDTLVPHEPTLEGEELGTDAESHTPEEYQARMAQMQSDYEIAELQRQEEVHTYLERIDALQSKLQYLTKESAESARQAASEATSDSLERKLAAKDEQIALLLEEGQQLSKSEVAQSSAARKLRSRIADDGKTIADLRRRLANMERTSTELSEKNRRLESAQKDSSTRLQRIPRLEKDLESLKVARDEKESTIQVLRREIETESKRADEAVKEVNNAAAEEQRRRLESLEEDLSNAKIEKKLTEDRSKADLKAAQEELQNEQERKKVAEAGLRNEISVLESRLESLRARSEEASTGNTDDSQAKLLRQVETLQSQYALARENWQGIETSLQARVTSLEKERSDVTRQEAEARKKARESGSNARKLQESLDEATRKSQILEHDLTQKQANAEKLEARILSFEQSLKEANDKLEREHHTWNESLNARIEEEKKKWQQERNSYAEQENPMSPGETPTLPRRSNTLELPGFSARRPMSRNASTELSIPITDKTHSRRNSGRPGRPQDAFSPNGMDSGRSTPFFSGNMPETPQFNDIDPDDLVETGSSPHRTVNDVISGSTNAAGPSVQLVERMSAKVRRLETEKAATKDEMARLSDQRDEARKEVVSLMREVEQKRTVDAKFAKLEADMAETQERYQTTLEMLGEKSEMVEELEDNVSDLKKMYRELVDSTMK